MVNKLILQGKLVRNPELKKSKSEKKICEFTVGWSYGDIKLYQNCVAYDKIAENVLKYFEKGQWIIVSGQLFTQVWNKKDGSKRKQNKLTVQECHFCGAKDQVKDISDFEFEEVTDEQVENLPW